MPPEARVAIFEDDEITRRILKDDLKPHGHRIVLEVASMAEALTAIPNLDKLGVQVAIIDGNLSPGERFGFEGRAINKQIKELFPDIKTVGHSLDSVVEVTNISVEKYTPRIGYVVTEL